MTDPNAAGLPPIRRRSRVPSGPPASSGGGWGDEPAGPRVAGAAGRRGAGAWETVARGPVALERPNLVLVLALVATTLVALGVALLGTADGRVLAATMLVGMFGGVVLLGLARLDANRKRSGGRFTDWSIESSKVATGLFAIGWLAGLVSLWRLALDLSRIFT